VIGEVALMKLDNKLRTSNCNLILDSIKIGGIKMNEDLAYSKYGKEKTQWKGSSIRIVGINFPEKENTNPKALEEELMHSLALFLKTIENQKIVKTAPIILERFKKEYLEKHKWHGSDSHLKKVICYFQEAVEEEVKNFQSCSEKELYTYPWPLYGKGVFL